MIKFKVGDKAKVVTPIISGEILARQFDNEDNVLFLLSWVDDNGPHERWFLETELELMEISDGR